MSGAMAATISPAANRIRPPTSDGVGPWSSQRRPASTIPTTSASRYAVNPQL